MKDAKYVYGCSMKSGSFSAALGKAAKIDCIVKVNVRRLIARGTKGGNKNEEAVDVRTIGEILRSQSQRGVEGEDQDDIRVFEMPIGSYAQEATFVPKREQRDEDDGYLLSYVFDESQLDEVTGEARSDARSELWIIDAWNMKEVVAKIRLPQRSEFLIASPPLHSLD